MSQYRMDHGQYAWSPLVRRERLTWPGGARVAVAFVVSLGHYEADPPPGAFDPPTHRSPLRIMPPPDYPTVTHREYGHRVGIFRLFDLFDAHAIRAMAAVDALTAQGYPQLVTECRRRGWEVIAHGVGQRRAITAGMSETDERSYIRSAMDAVGRAAGGRPGGWLSPEQSESARTPTLLREVGVDYLCDWANDDQPYLIGPAPDPLVSLPLMQDISDVTLHWNRRVTMARWAEVVCEAFDTLYREGSDGGRLFVLPLHPWCIGQPFRARYLDQVLAHVTGRDGVWVTTGAEVSAWYRRGSRELRDTAGSEGRVEDPHLPRKFPGLGSWYTAHGGLRSMGEAATQLDRHLVARDLDELPHEWDTRYELIHGVLYMSRRPSYDHQHVIARLTMKVGPAVLAAGGDVVPEPGIVWDEDGEDNVSPDLAILLEVPRPPRGEKLRRCPDIVIEVLSGGADSRRRDLDAKRDLYWRRSAKEYWIVDPARQELLRLTRGPAGWIEARLASHDVLATPLLPDWAGAQVAELLS